MGDAADRDQDLLGLDRGAAAELGDHAGAAGADLFDLDAGADVDAEVLAQRFADFFAGEGLVSREQVLAALDQGHPGAEARPGLGELAADRAAAEHDHARRHPLGGGRLAVVPGADAVEAVDRRHRRAAAGGDDDRRPRGQDLVADEDPALAVEAAGAAVEVDAAFFEPGQLGRVVAVVDHLVAPVEDRLRVELARRRHRHSGQPPRLGEHVGGAQQRLRGHAGVVGAFAADQVGLDDRHRHPGVGQPPGADLARGARSEHDRVVGLLAHTDTVPDTVQFQAQ